MAALEVHSITRRYEDRLAVDGLSFTLEPGTILGLVGPNGAGKTTTLRSIAGVLPLQEGRILVDGADLAEQELQAKRRLAYVPDEPAPFEVLTVEEHLAFTARLYGLKDWRPRAEELLEQPLLRGRHGQHDLGGRRPPAGGVDGAQHAVEELLVRELRAEVVGPGLGHPPVAPGDPVHGGPAPAAREAEHVAVHGVLGPHPLALHRPPQRREAVPPLGGALVLEGLRRGVHPAA